MKPRFSSPRGPAADIIPPPLPRPFFARPVLEVARDCIGKLLISRVGQSLVAGRIVETEAYRGPEDAAAHSYKGRRTPRTEVMFGPPGHAYVFLLYGIHCAFNIVTGRENEPEAVLVRALQPVLGLQIIAQRRGKAASSPDLTNGPGKLSQALGIGRGHNGHDLTTGPLTLSWDEPLPTRRSTRIGIDYAGAWALEPWRFYAEGNPHVSRFRAPRPLPQS
jgi:DNA-3-methyladenine glycosylase